MSSKRLVVQLAPLTPEIIDKFTVKKRSTEKRLKTTDSVLHTPKASLELAVELKKVIYERNILTSKTRKRVFDCLDELKSNTETETRNLKREQALLEIINSEIKYVKQLETIINYFMKPVQEKKLLTADHYETLFGNIETIYNVNKQLLQELDKGFENVANAFSNIAPYLKLYSVYAYDFRKIIEILQNARGCNPVFAKFIENQETRPEVQNKLSALLIAPIQRVPRYKLLLAQLYDLTIPKDKDYKLLKTCMQKIEDAAAHINKIVGEQENAQRLLELQRYLRDNKLNIITPGRRLQKEGVLHKMSTKRHNEKVYLVLMNDIIVLNKMKKEELVVDSLKVEYIFPLNKCKITEILDKGCVKINCLEVEVILYHEQLSETIKWIQAIKEAINNHLEDRKSLRKENSNRRPVKRKDVNEYHEVGLSPGRPLKKRRLAISQQSPSTSNHLNHRISARKSIHSACNSTPIKLESNPETANLHNTSFPLLDTSRFSNESHLPSETVLENKPELTNKVKAFPFKEEDQNISKLSTVFKNISSSIRGFLGFKGKKQ